MTREVKKFILDIENISPIVRIKIVFVPTIVSLVTRGNERFVDFVDFMKILFYVLIFLFI